MGIQLGGLASGMDTTSLISQLMQVERQPISLKQEEIGKLTQSKKLWEQINTKLNTFKSAISDIKLSSAFTSKLVSSSNEAKVTGTATTGASDTAYTLEKITLATPAKITSGAALALTDGVKANTTGTSTIADPNKRFNDGTTVAAGSFKINGKSISVAATDTINLVITKINGSGAGVTASFDKTAGTIKLEANEASSSKRIEFDAVDTSGFMTAVGLGAQLGQKVSNGVNPDQSRLLQDVGTFAGVQSGFFTINGSTFEIDKTKDTLSGILSKINASSAGVTAFYDQDTKKVTITSRETGKELSMENDTSGFLNAIGVLNQTGDTDGGAEKSIYKGTDAKVTINGVEFTKSSNKFLMNGVSFELKSETDVGEKITITAKTDTDKTVSKIKGFVDKYNDLISYLEENTKVTTGSDGVTSAPLQGDTMATNLIYELRQKVTGVVSGITANYSQASSIGLQAKDSKSSKITLDETKLKEALTASPEDVRKLFSQSSTGTVDNEAVASGDGTKKEYYFAKKPSTVSGMEITVGSTIISGTNIITSGTPGAGQVLVDLTSGKMTFGTAPAAGDGISAKYTYDTKTTNEDGIAVRIDKFLSPYTIYNGTVQRQIKSYQTRIDDVKKWITNFDERMQLREESLKKQFAAMETAMQQSSSQGQWLASQLSGLQ